jgi:hypothetical protein
MERTLNWLSLILLLISLPARALSQNTGGFNLLIEPILAYEFTSRDTPTPHRAGMLVYGARFTAGRPHLSLEGEYTLGNDTEIFTTPVAATINTKKENGRLGGRGTYAIGSMLDAILRFGGQASKATVETVPVSGTSSTAYGKWEIHPYLGGGFQLSPFPQASLGLEANYVFYSLSDYTKNSIQLSTSVKFNLNSK